MEKLLNSLLDQLLENKELKIHLKEKEILKKKLLIHARDAEQLNKYLSLCKKPSEHGQIITNEQLHDELLEHIKKTDNVTKELAEQFNKKKEENNKLFKQINEELFKQISEQLLNLFNQKEHFKECKQEIKDNMEKNLVNRIENCREIFNGYRLKTKNDSCRYPECKCYVYVKVK